MAINALVEQMCEQEGVGFVYLWGYLVGKEDIYMRDGLHLSGKGAALTVGLVYRSPNINIEENEGVHNPIQEVSKGDCVIIGDFNHGHIQWTFLQSTGREDQEFLNLVQDSFLSQHLLEPTKE